MPCNNIAESIRVVLDKEDRLESYRFLKKSCGGSIGSESILLDRLRGKKIAEILEMQTDNFAPVRITPDNIEGFLRLKHFVALKTVLETLSGREIGGGPNAACNIVEISYGDNSLMVDAEFSVALETHKIRPCSYCDSD